MESSMRLSHLAASFILLPALLAAVTATAQDVKPFEPVSGQAGKDVVWVPTPPELVEKMLDMAKVKPQDYVMDLGSGDGRNIIAAAKRGARTLGVEFNPDMVELSRRAAAEAGVGDKAVFVQGDMYEADISAASVLAIFLLPMNMDRLVPKFLALRPGSRIVSNTFEPTGWTPDETHHIGEPCSMWCKAVLYIVPAQAAGTWRMAGNAGELVFSQTFQMLSGTLFKGGKSLPVTNGRLLGEHITFTAGGMHYEGDIHGGKMEGTIRAVADRNGKPGGKPANTWKAEQR